MLCLGYPGLACLEPGRQGLGWLRHISGRLISTIVDQHLRPARHAEGCTGRQCALDCPVREYEADMSEPVLASQIAAAKAEEDRFKALAAALNGGGQ